LNMLRELRGERMQKDIAEALDIELTMLSRYENGRCNPTVSQAARICEFYGKDVYFIWQKSDLDYSRLHAAGAEKEKRRVPCRKITVRLNEGLYSRLQAVCKRLKLTQAAYLERCVLRDEKAQKKSSRPAGTGTAATPNNVTAIIAEKEGKVNEYVNEYVDEYKHG